MNTRNIFRLILGAAAVSAVAATVFTAQTPAPGPGQIAIPQPCTPELIAAEDAAAAAAAAGGRGARVVPCHRPDPRENLKPGLYDAGQAAKGLRLATTLKQPDGMFDPNPSPNGRSLDYANSDLAFSANSKVAIQGNFHGLIVYDIAEPAEAKLKTIVVCPGSGRYFDIWQLGLHVGGKLWPDRLFGNAFTKRRRARWGCRRCPSRGGQCRCWWSRSSRTRCRRRSRSGAAGSESYVWRPSLRHQRSEQTETGGDRADLPRLAYAFDRSGPERQGQHLCLRLGFVRYSLCRREDRLCRRS